MDELKKAKVVAFMIIRNNVVMPELIGRFPMSHINEVAYGSFNQILDQLDMTRAEEMFDQGKADWEKMENEKHAHIN